MNMKGSKTLLLRILLSVHLMFVSPLVMISDSYAGPGKNGQQARGMSLDQAVAQVQQQTGGRVLRAQQDGSVYVIKVLMPSGVVKTVRVNAR
jgi:hypothetical protein